MLNLRRKLTAELFQDATPLEVLVQSLDAAGAEPHPVQMGHTIISMVAAAIMITIQIVDDDDVTRT